MQTIRDTLCAQRAALEEVTRELAEIEQRLRSRNAAHLVGRVRIMIQGAQGFLADALRQPLEAVTDEAGAERAA